MNDESENYTELTFLGTGEAFNPDLNTTSYLIKTGDLSLMVDAGYNSPDQFMRLLSQNDSSQSYLKDSPTHLLFTHLHGDHVGGICRLLVPAWELGRTKSLEIYCPQEGLTQSHQKFGKLFDYPDGAHMIESRLHLDYGALADRIESQFQRNYHFWENEQTIGSLTIKTAQTKHSITNYALRFDGFGKNGKFSFVLSGDGELTDASKALFKGTDFLVHEAFYIDNPDAKNHATARQVVDFAIEANIPKVGLVHINRYELLKTKELMELCEYARVHDVKLVMPKDLSMQKF